MRYTHPTYFQEVTLKPHVCPNTVTVRRHHCNAVAYIHNIVTVILTSDYVSFSHSNHDALIKILHPAAMH